MLTAGEAEDRRIVRRRTSPENPAIFLSFRGLRGSDHSISGQSRKESLETRSIAGLAAYIGVDRAIIRFGWAIARLSVRVIAATPTVIAIGLFNWTRLRALPRNASFGGGGKSDQTVDVGATPPFCADLLAIVVGRARRLHSMRGPDRGARLVAGSAVVARPRPQGTELHGVRSGATPGLRPRRSDTSPRFADERDPACPQDSRTSGTPRCPRDSRTHGRPPRLRVASRSYCPSCRIGTGGRWDRR